MRSLSLYSRSGYSDSKFWPFANFILIRNLKEAQILERGRAEGLESMLERQATRRFNASTGERLSALLAGVSEPDRLKAVGDAVVECGTGAELLAAAKRIVSTSN